MLDDNGAVAATSCTDRQLMLFEVESGKLLCRAQCGEITTGMCFSENGRHLITTSSLGLIYVWKLPEEVQNLLTRSQIRHSATGTSAILDRIEEEELEDSVKTNKQK